MNYPILSREELLSEVRAKLGGRGAATTLARIRGISVAAAAKWLRLGIPVKEVGIISALTGIPAHIIRPDEYLPPIERQS